MSADVIVRRLGVQPYAATWEAMQQFTAARADATADELWLLQHPPVYTLGRNAKTAAPVGDIPIVAVDRGGDITYHGPGQCVLYTLVDLRRRGLGVKALVGLLEQSVLDLLAERGIAGERRAGAPGVYVGGRKLAALGLRVRHGRSYHGLALNVAMSLAPFTRIAPCGYAGLEVTQLSDLIDGASPATAGQAMAAHLIRNIGYNAPHYTDDWDVHGRRR